jgi:cytochrome c peroxidase
MKLLVKPRFIVIAAVAIFAAAATMFGYVGAASITAAPTTPELSDIELLGKYVFFDKVSTPSRMSCMTCHTPRTGGTYFDQEVNLHQVAVTGANPPTVGNLKPPTNAYASLIKPFSNEGCIGGGGLTGYCGGNFWNGRAEGNVTAAFSGATKHIGEEIFYLTNGDPLPLTPDVLTVYAGYFGPTADQALTPMPNLVEQNIQRQSVCNHVKSAKYVPLYKKVWGLTSIAAKPKCMSQLWM